MEIVQAIIDRINYIGAAILFVIGLYTVLTHPNLIKKVIGINIMETAVFLLMVSVGYVAGGNAPILGLTKEQTSELYVNPLPTAMILTGIVVAVSITAYSLSLIVKIYEAYGTIEVDEIMELRSEKAVE
ncbi:cation:proton antiporter subunit C [Serpentinicella sp. ANB-PHB4]|uniref:cation:proton antiporter subunit C n=1 Tax=Serpentinicella sp. ANB-PHB4 TaxID=3074076 RepID=UPI002856A395|nr:cation:proton antiporter subunit C [Serpentinicella sp. ANB-PHB4]MDR5659342.1 cation:proton antiporter subunit C [Serpentinicella sp. ANB-PHB4]